MQVDSLLELFGIGIVGFGLAMALVAALSAWRPRLRLWSRWPDGLPPIVATGLVMQGAAACLLGLVIAQTGSVTSKLPEVAAVISALVLYVAASAALVIGSQAARKRRQAQQP